MNATGNVDNNNLNAPLTVALYTKPSKKAKGKSDAGKAPESDPKDTNCLIKGKPDLYQPMNGDDSKWEKRDGENDRNYFNCYFSQSNDTFDNGIMSLKLKKDGNGSYTSGEYRTKRPDYGFGYYETRMKAAKGKGLVAGTFFTYTGVYGQQGHNEIDIEIIPDKNDPNREVVQLNYYYNGHGADQTLKFVVDNLGFDPSTGFHNYGFLWRPDSIAWYIDGKVVHKATEYIPQNPSQIMVNFWPGTAAESSWLSGTYHGGNQSVQYDWIKYMSIDHSNKPSAQEAENPAPEAAANVPAVENTPAPTANVEFTPTVQISVPSTVAAAPAPVQPEKGKFVAPASGCLLGANFNNVYLDDSPRTPDYIKAITDKKIPYFSNPLKSAATGLNWFWSDVVVDDIAKPVGDFFSKPWNVFSKSVDLFNKRTGKNISVTFAYQHIYNKFHNEYMKFPLHFIKDANNRKLVPGIVLDASDIPQDSSRYFLDQMLDWLNDPNSDFYKAMQGWATAAAKEGGPIIFCPLPGANTNMYRWGGWCNGKENGPAKYREVFKIHELFVQSGATNVTFALALEGNSEVLNKEGSPEETIGGGGDWNLPENYISRGDVELLLFSGHRKTMDQTFGSLFKSAKPYFETKTDIPAGIFAVSSGPLEDKPKFISDLYGYAANGAAPNLKMISLSNIDETQDFRLISPLDKPDTLKEIVNAKSDDELKGIIAYYSKVVDVGKPKLVGKNGEVKTYEIELYRRLAGSGSAGAAPGSLLIPVVVKSDNELADKEDNYGRIAKVSNVKLVKTEEINGENVFTYIFTLTEMPPVPDRYFGTLKTYQDIVKNPWFIGTAVTPEVDGSLLKKEAVTSKKSKDVEDYLSAAYDVSTSKIYFNTQLFNDKTVPLFPYSINMGLFTLGPIEQKVAPLVHPRSTEYDPEFRLKSIERYEQLANRLNSAEVSPKLLEVFKSEKQYLGFVQSMWTGAQDFVSEHVGGRLMDFNALKGEIGELKPDASKKDQEEYWKKARIIMNRNILIEIIKMLSTLDRKSPFYIRALDKLKNFFFGWIERGIINGNNYTLITDPMIDGAIIGDLMETNGLAGTDEYKKLKDVESKYYKLQEKSIKTDEELKYLHLTLRPAYEAAIKAGQEKLKKNGVDVKTFSEEFRTNVSFRLVPIPNTNNFKFDIIENSDVASDTYGFRSATWGICSKIIQLANDKSYWEKKPYNNNLPFAFAKKEQLSTEERMGLIASAKELQARVMIECYFSDNQSNPGVDKKWVKCTPDGKPIPESQLDPKSKMILKQMRILYFDAAGRLLNDASGCIGSKENAKWPEYLGFAIQKEGFKATFDPGYDPFILTAASRWVWHKTVNTLEDVQWKKPDDFYLSKQIAFDIDILEYQNAKVVAEAVPGEATKANAENKRKEIIQKYDAFMNDKDLSDEFKNKVKIQIHNLLMQGDAEEQKRADGILFYLD